MGMFGVLIRKQIAERAQVFKGKKPDIWGAVLSLALAAALMYLFVMLAKMVAEAYIEIPVDNVISRRSRERELLIMWYLAVLVLGVFSGARSINHALFENDDLKLFITMPIPPRAIYLSKAVAIYFKQLIVVLLLVVPVNVVLATATGRGVEYILFTLIVSVLICTMTIAVSSFVALPAFRVKRFISSKYVMLLIALTVLLGVVFWGYSYILAAFRDLLTTGRLQFFFTSATMHGIGDFTSKAYPVVFLADLTLASIEDAQGIGYNLGISAGIALLLTLIGGAMISSLFDKAVVSRASRTSAKMPAIYSYGRKSAFGTLMKKEFTEVLRTPQYAFQCFSVALIMPLMTYFTMQVGVSLLTDTVGVSMNFELALFIIILFSVLTNTFCATNVSRDGTVFYMMKTLPFSAKTYVWAKITFCGIVSALSCAISAGVLGGVKFVSAEQTVFLVFVGMCAAIAEIVFATKRDLVSPTFGEDESNMLKDSSRTASMLIIIGVIGACLLGGGALLINLVSILSGKGAYSAQWAYLVGGIGAPLILILSVIYLYAGLDRKYSGLIEGGRR